MHSATLVVESYLSGCRVDTFLARHFRSYTPWRMHRMVRAGQVTVEGSVAAPDRRVFTNETVTIQLLEPPDNLMPAEDITFGIVYEDQWLLIVNKPAGIPSQATVDPKRPSMESLVRQQLKLKKIYLHHRLDRDTTGVLLLSKSSRPNGKLTEMFQQHSFRKKYMAIAAKTHAISKNHSWTVENHLAPVRDAKSGPP